MPKSTVLRRVISQCPHLPWKKRFDKYVIKPEHGSGGTGVNLESKDWTLESCALVYGSCLRQGYHEGNVELRMLKNHSEWSAVGWYVPSEDTEPPAFRAEFDWMPELQACVESALPNTQFLALDIRANAENLSLLEVNGVWGLTYDWLLHGNVLQELIKWLWLRLVYSNLWARLWKMAESAARKFRFRKHAARVWF